MELQTIDAEIKAGQIYTSLLRKAWDCLNLAQSDYKDPKLAELLPKLKNRVAELEEGRDTRLLHLGAQRAELLGETAETIRIPAESVLKMAAGIAKAKLQG